METALELSHREFMKLDRDYNRSARAADLIYVSDTECGIKRIKKGKGFCYLLEDRPVKDKTIRKRIQRLAIPPAWTDVWICVQENGHLQATGFDQRKRKQYRYHPLWHSLRNETKFHRLYEFGKALPGLRKKMKADLATRELPEEKVIATVICLMEQTCIRIGNGDYEKLYGSYGLTTLKDNHVKVSGDTLHFSFRGKKGVFQNVRLRNRRLARTIQRCRDIPGKELFQFIDSNGKRQPIDSGMVNAYIKEGAAGDFSAKDFRTWAGTLNMIRALSCQEPFDSEADCRKKIITALDEVSAQLGNSRTICRKYYVHPGVIRLYEEGALVKYLQSNGASEQAEDLEGLNAEEQTLMKILRRLL